MNLPAKPTVVISGAGWATPLAVGSGSTALQGLLRHAPHLASERARRIDDSALTGLSLPGSEWRDDRTTWLSACCIDLAMREAELPIAGLPSHRVGMVFGCALAGQLGMITFAEEVRSQSARFVSPLHFPQTVGNYAAGALARSFHIRGPNLTVARGVASGLEAVVAGCRMIRDGMADAVLAGGTDTLIEALVPALQAESQDLVEGACWFVLEHVGARAERGLDPRPPLAVAASWRETRIDVGGAAPKSSTPLPHGSPVVPRRSVAGAREIGAVHLESVTGNCLAAGGAAAVIGGIGILHGLGPELLALTRAPGTPAVTAPTISFSAHGQAAMPDFAQAVALDRARNHAIELTLKPTSQAWSVGIHGA